MNDELYRQTRDAIREPRCQYEKALQHGYFSCHKARVVALGEREAIHCTHDIAYGRCCDYYTLLLKKSGFALGSPHLETHLTFNRAMKLQIGGLQGAMQLRNSMVAKQAGAHGAQSTDVAACLKQLSERYPDYDSLDFSNVVPHIQRFSMPRRRGK